VGDSKYATLKRRREHEGEVKTTTCGSVGVGEAKIGRFLVKNARETHVCGISSNLPEKLNIRFILQVFETSGGKLSILKLWGLN
jgi:hypothetical protein